MEPSDDRYNPRDRFPVSRLHTSNILNLGDQRVICSKYDKEGQFVYIGSEDGFVRILSATGKNAQLYELKPETSAPAICIAVNTASTQLKNSAMVAYSDGGLGYWHATSKQLLSFKQFEFMLYCCGFSSNGVTYSFAGEDFKIHIGNLGKNNTFQMKEGRLGEHSNRVYCTKWHDKDPNLLFSGGWDETLYFWDIRCQEAVNKLFKITLSGEGIDVKDDLLLVGNEDFEYQIKLYDLKMNKFHRVQWTDYGPHKSMVSSCAFDQNHNIVAGAIKTSEVRLFQDGKCVDVFNQIDKHLYSVAVSPNKNECVATYGQGDVVFFTY